MDVLEWKSRYMFDFHAHPDIIRKKMFEFGSKIDMAYLVNHPNRLNDCLDIIEHFSEYTVRNGSKIAALKPHELRAFKDDFMTLWRGFNEIEKGKEFLSPATRSMIVDFKKEKLIPAYNTLNPQYKPQSISK